MVELIKEDIKNILSRKRFLFPAILTFLAALGVTVYTKFKFWNDQTFFFAMQVFLFNIFNVIIGIALIIGIYCRKYTRNSINMVEEKGKGRAAGVLSKVLSGTFVIISCYLLMMVWILLLGIIFGAHSSDSQMMAFVLRLCMDCIASITSFAASILFLYIFEFPAVPIVVYVVLMHVVALILKYNNFYASATHKSMCLLVPKVTADSAYTQLLLSDFEILYVVEFIIQFIVPVLLSIIVFKLKKVKNTDKKSSIKM